MITRILGEGRTGTLDRQGGIFIEIIGKIFCGPIPGKCSDIIKTKNTLKKAGKKFCPDRVARWFIFKQNIPIWANFGVSCNDICWSILMATWYILWSFWYIFLVLLYFVIILVYFSRFGMLHQEKSGNPVGKTAEKG
jgi:hypothetical protein